MSDSGTVYETAWFGDFGYEIWHDEDRESPCDDYDLCFLGKFGRYGRPGWVFTGTYIDEERPEFRRTPEGHYIEEDSDYALFPVASRNDRLFVCWDEPEYATTAVYVRLRSDLEQLAYPQRLTLAEEAQEKLEEWSRWFNGEAYGFTIENRQGEVLESLWGFDDIRDCKEEAIVSITYTQAQAKEKDNE